jgi:hypothetical protein
MRAPGRAAVNSPGVSPEPPQAAAIEAVAMITKQSEGLIRTPNPRIRFAYAVYTRQAACIIRANHEELPT